LFNNQPPTLRAGQPSTFLSPSTVPAEILPFPTSIPHLFRRFSPPLVFFAVEKFPTRLFFSVGTLFFSQSPYLVGCVYPRAQTFVHCTLCNALGILPPGIRFGQPPFVPHFHPKDTPKPGNRFNRAPLANPQKTHGTPKRHTQWVFCPCLPACTFSLFFRFLPLVSGTVWPVRTPLSSLSLSHLSSLIPPPPRDVLPPLPWLVPYWDFCIFKSFLSTPVSLTPFFWSPSAGLPPHRLKPPHFS